MRRQRAGNTLWVVCVLAVLMTGCTRYQLWPLERPPVLLDEHGEQHRFYRATIMWNGLLWNHDISCLVETPPENDQVFLRHIAHSTPRRRNTEELWDTADWLTNDLPEEQVRWIISNEPTVIGMGPPTDRKPPLTKGFRAQYMRDDDLNKVVDLLVIHDKWPRYTGTQLNRHIEPPPPGRRFIKLDPPKTLREIMATRPWLR